MLREAGCTHVIIGHSERRQFFGETDETRARRVAAPRSRAALTPIVCVGETLARARGATPPLAVIERQVRGALAGPRRRRRSQRCVVAYEPVWAIGTGRTATPGAGPGGPRRHPRPARRARRPRMWPTRVRILYGGSVKPDNIDDADGPARHRRRAGRRRQPRCGGVHAHRAVSGARVMIQALVTYVMPVDPRARVPLPDRRRAAADRQGRRHGRRLRRRQPDDLRQSGGAGNFLTRLTTGTAIVFMLTSLILTYGQSRSQHVAPDREAARGHGPGRAGGPRRRRPGRRARRRRRSRAPRPRSRRRRRPRRRRNSSTAFDPSVTSLRSRPSARMAELADALV